MPFKAFLISIFIFLLSFYPIFSFEEETKCLTFPFLYNKDFKDRVLSTVYFDSTGRPKNQCVAYSSDGLFAVHYDTSGSNRVPLVDLNRNGIPDYVDSALYYLEYAYKVYVDVMGFDPPPKDSGRGGSDAYDFYLWEIGNGLADEVAYGWTIPDIEIKEPGVFQKFACYSILDNDFSPYDTAFFSNGTKRATFRESGYLGLKITTAHELHHLFQFGYGDPNFPSFNEMTSTFMEWRVHPETKDYLQFVASLFRDLQKYVLSDPTYYVGYRYAIFLQYLYKRFGDFPIVEVWRNIGRGNSALLSLELALKACGSSISEALANFLPYLYYSGGRARPNLLPNAELFPEVKYYLDQKFNGTSISNHILRPLEIMALRFVFPGITFETLNDTLVIYLANIDSYSGINQIKDSARECTIILSEIPTGNGIQLYPRNVFYQFQGDRNLIADSLFLSYGYKTFATTSSFPNPWKFGKEHLNFPVPPNAPVDGSVELRIFDSNLNEISLPSNTFKISIVNKIRVVAFENFPTKLPSGVYFFKVRYKDSEIFGKFSVID